MQKFRRGVPEKSSVYICKNSLMKEAVKTVPGWEVLGEQGCTVSIGSGNSGLVLHTVGSSVVAVCSGQWMWFAGE